MSKLDKKKIEEIKQKVKDDYVGKTEDELMAELKKVSKNLDGKEKMIEKLKPLLNKKQKEKLDKILKQLK